MRKMNTSKHIPQRMCIACRQTREKRQLVRLLRNHEGIIHVDTGGRKSGRGAYLCRIPNCWNSAIADGRLEHALRINLTTENREQLTKYGKMLAMDG